MGFLEKEKKPVGPSPEMVRLTEVGSKLRMLEERYSMLRKKTQLTEQNLIRFERDVDSELKMLNEQIADFKTQVQKLRDQIDVLITRTEEFARGEEVKVIAKYLEYINPSRFITREEAQRMLDGSK